MIKKKDLHVLHAQRALQASHGLHAFHAPLALPVHLALKSLEIVFKLKLELELFINICYTLKPFHHMRRKYILCGKQALRIKSHRLELSVIE